LCSVTIFPLENRAIFEMWKNTVQRGRPQMKIWRMRIACWVHKATNTHSGYVLHNAFPLQQRLHERASMLRYTYIARLVKIKCLALPNNFYYNTPQTFISGAPALSYVRISFHPDRSDSPLRRHIGKFPLYNRVTSLKTANFRHRWDSLKSAIDSLHFPKRHSPVGVGDGTEWCMNWNVCHLDGFRDYKDSTVNKQYSDTSANEDNSFRNHIR